MDKFQEVVIFLVIISVCFQQTLAVNSRSTISCYSCSGIACTRATLVNQQAACSDPLDSCVTVFHGYSVAARGCSLEIDYEYRSKCQSGNSLECHKCSGNLCNNVAREDVKCISCNSTQEPDCLQNPQKLRAMRCPIGVTQNSYCFVNYVNNEIIRGCATSLRDQVSCYNDENCFLCLPENPEGCNSIGFPSNRRKCIACAAGECSDKTKTTSMYCKKIDDQCVALQMNGKVTKGCVATLSDAQSKFCTANEKSCTKCSANDCNKDAFPETTGGGSGGASPIVAVQAILWITLATCSIVWLM